MRRGTLFFSVILLVLLAPTLCSAEWKLLEGKIYENTYGTQYYFDTKLSYAEGSSSKAPLVILWGKTEFHGKSDPAYVKLVSLMGNPEIAVMEIKYWVDINNKKAAMLYGVLYDGKGRTLSTDDVKNPQYVDIPTGSAAETTWRMVKDLHEKGAIQK